MSPLNLDDSFNPFSTPAPTQKQIEEEYSTEEETSVNNVTVIEQEETTQGDNGEVVTRRLTFNTPTREYDFYFWRRW